MDIDYLKQPYIEETMPPEYSVLVILFRRPQALGQETRTIRDHSQLP